MVNIQKRDWVILFGGAGREEIIFTLLKKKINIIKIIIPSNSSLKLLNSVQLIKEKTNIKIDKYSKINFSNFSKNNKNNILLCIGFPYIIKNSFLSSFYLAINIHPTLLPKYKGPTSGAYIILNKEKYSGSTAHLMEEKVDSGEIIAQKKFKLSKFDTIRSIQLKTYLLEPSLILLVIKNINNNKKLKINNRIKRKMYKRIPSDSQIDPKKSLLKLYDSIRASDPKEFPSFFIINKKKVYIKLSTSKKFIIKKDFSL
ncbi:formyltransferase family protein [Alphaproteobacteria bacterium]|nr:formyltransferase family protein [Alphaproteobacteria bacterium]